VQRSHRFALGQRAIGLNGCVHHFLRRQVGEGVQPGLERGSAIQYGRSDLDGRQFLGADGIDQLRRRREAEIGLIHGNGSSTTRASVGAASAEKGFSGNFHHFDVRI